MFGLLLIQDHKRIFSLFLFVKEINILCLIKVISYFSHCIYYIFAYLQNWVFGIKIADGFIFFFNTYVIFCISL